MHVLSVPQQVVICFGLCQGLSAPPDVMRVMTGSIDAQLMIVNEWMQVNAKWWEDDLHSSGLLQMRLCSSHLCCHRVLCQLWRLLLQVVARLLPGCGVP